MRGFWGGIRSTAGRALVLAALLPALGACGFTPMYARPATGSAMSQITVKTPDTRTGFLLRQELEDKLALNRDGQPRYRLAVQLVEKRRPRGLNPDDTANRYELQLTASYVLTEIATGQVVLEKTVPVNVTADATSEPYAGVVEQQDSQRRAAAEAAEIIKTEVAQAFAPK
jgi:LPS-assembly lipoprotein